MGLLRRREGLLHADVELLMPRLEPDAAARTQRPGLLDLSKPEQLAEELSCFVLTPGWGGNLHMVKSFDEHARNLIGDGLFCPLERREATTASHA